MKDLNPYVKVTFGVIVTIIVMVILTLTFGDKKKNEVENNEVGQEENKDIQPELSEEEYLEMMRESLSKESDYKYTVPMKDYIEEVNNDGILYVYYYSPVCSYCIENTPSLIKGLNDSNKEVDKDFRFIQVDITHSQDEYNTLAELEGTPTLIKYKDGIEQFRVVGSGNPAIFFEDMFNDSKDIREHVDTNNKNFNLREEFDGVEYVTDEELDKLIEENKDAIE